MALDNPDGWSWYSELSIANPSVDYQMRLVVKRGSGVNDPANGIMYDEGHCYHDDMRDVRVGTTSDPDTADQLPQWTESVTSGIERVMWIQTNGNATLYLFAGSGEASEYSDGGAVFDYFTHWTSDDTGNWKHTNIGNNHHHWWYENDTFETYKEWRAVALFKSWNAGNWDNSGFVFTPDDTSAWYAVDHVALYFEHRTSNGADSSHLFTKLDLKNEGTAYTTTLKRCDKPVVDTKLLIRLCYAADRVYYEIYDLDSNTQLLSDAITNASQIPPPSDAKYFCWEAWDSAGGIFSYLSPTYLDLGNKTFNGGMELNVDYWFLKKYSSVEPTWSGFGAWTEIGVAPPASTGKLSDIDVTPARVVTTDFPAAAGLPVGEKIRIYARAVSGQEKEILLAALT